MDRQPKKIGIPENSRRKLEYFNSYFTVFPDIFSDESHKLWFRHCVDRIQILLGLDSLGILNDLDVSRRLLAIESELHGRALTMNAREFETALFSSDTTRKPHDSLREADPGYLATQALELERIQRVPTDRRSLYIKSELRGMMDIYRLLQASTLEFTIEEPGILRRKFAGEQELITPSDSFLILGEQKIIDKDGVMQTIVVTDRDPVRQIPERRYILFGPTLLSHCDAIIECIRSEVKGDFIQWFILAYGNGKFSNISENNSTDILLKRYRTDIFALAQVIAMHMRVDGNERGVNLSGISLVERRKLMKNAVPDVLLMIAHLSSMEELAKRPEVNERSRFLDYQSELEETQKILAARAEQLGSNTSNGKRPHLDNDPISPNVAKARGWSEEKIRERFPGINDGTQRWTYMK